MMTFYQEEWDLGDAECIPGCYPEGQWCDQEGAGQLGECSFPPSRLCDALLRQEGGFADSVEMAEAPCQRRQLEGVLPRLASPLGVCVPHLRHLPPGQGSARLPPRHVAGHPIHVGWIRYGAPREQVP